MFLLIGHSTERTFRRFVEYTWNQGVPADVLDLALLRESTVEAAVEERPDGLAVTIGQRRFELGAYDAFYTRAYSTDLGDRRANAMSLRLIRSISGYLNVVGGTVVNRPAAGSSNSNKFIHGTLMRSYGFSVPETFIVGSSEEGKKLRATGWSFISKSCSGTKTRVLEIGDELWDRVGALDYSPSIVQRRIPGADVRVHVVGDELLSERIESSRVDYRFHDATVPPNRYSICDVPQQIAASCLAYCEDQGLLFAGIDFKVTDDDEWYVLEANPMPGYESYDRRQGHRISRALFELLTSHRETPPVRPGVTSGLGRGPSMLPSAQNDAPASQTINERSCDAPEQFVVEGRRPILTSLHCERRLRPEEYWVLET